MVPTGSVPVGSVTEETDVTAIEICVEDVAGVVAAAAFRQAAGTAPLTFHRAVDAVPDRAETLLVLIGLGDDRVLTTGEDPTRARPDELAALVEQAGDDIVVLATGGIRVSTVDAILDATGARELHLRAPAATGWGTDRGAVQMVVDRVRDADHLARRAGEAS